MIFLYREPGHGVKSNCAPRLFALLFQAIMQPSADSGIGRLTHIIADRTSIYKKETQNEEKSKKILWFPVYSRTLNTANCMIMQEKKQAEEFSSWI
ncbi:MAG: hypothetical protein CVV45_20780 [Spirochaetae bacterium HGW-Spirochaetae-10]|nr:MAG: hypothetical protein CVV45_20780 [Spirochaetae bacterium HGW-Spirochaetae-10]